MQNHKQSSKTKETFHSQRARSSGKIHQPQQTPSLPTNWEKLKDAGKFSNACDNLFLATPENLNLHQVGTENAITFTSNQSQVNLQVSALIELKISILKPLCKKGDKSCD